MGDQAATRSVVKRKKEASIRPTNQQTGPSLAGTCGGQHCRGETSGPQDPPDQPVQQSPGFLKSKDKTTTRSEGLPAVGRKELSAKSIQLRSRSSKGN